MLLERNPGALDGWRLLVWKKKANHPELTWKKEWYKIAVRWLPSKSGGREFSVIIWSVTFSVEWEGRRKPDSKMDLDSFLKWQEKQLRLIGKR